MAGNSEFKWHDMDVQHLLIEAAEVVVVDDHAVEAGIVGVLDLDPAADRVAAIEIVGALTPAVVVALVLIARARAENHAHAASPRTDRRIAVPNLGTELVKEHARG